MGQPTMGDIAAHLGISRPLVSIVLRGAAGASAETRQRVLQAAKELGYTPHQGARTLRQSRSRQLGVTFTPAHASEPDIVEAISAAAQEHGYQVVTTVRSGARSPRQAAEELLGYRCAANLHVGSDLAPAELKELAVQSAVPTVVIGPGRRNPAYDVVRSAGDHGIAGVVEHLAALGHWRLIYLHCPELPSAAERLRGFRTGARRVGLDGEVVQVDGLGYTEEAGSAAARRLLARPELPTALVAGNDQQALGALWVLARAGVSVPEQISLTGFDDTRYARLSAVQLTTAAQDTAAMGRRAVQLAVARIDDPDLAPSATSFEPQLIVRTSTAAPPTRPAADVWTK